VLSSITARELISKALINEFSSWLSYFRYINSGEIMKKIGKLIKIGFAQAIHGYRCHWKF